MWKKNSIEKREDEGLTQSRHLSGQVGTESPKQAAIGQQVKGGVAPHGVEGKRVDSRWEAHLTHLPFPVGSHDDAQARSPKNTGKILGNQSASPTPEAVWRLGVEPGKHTTSLLSRRRGGALLLPTLSQHRSLGTRERRPRVVISRYSIHQIQQAEDGCF